MQSLVMAQSQDSAVEKIVVCVMGDKGVGKTTFIRNCLAISKENYDVHCSNCTMEICGMKLDIEIVDNPFPSEISGAKVVLILFDVTNRSTFDNLPELLDKTTSVAPQAFVCVIGNKADLLDDIQVEFKEAHDTCLSLDTHIIYFHLSANAVKVVEHCFWDIISRPLVYKHVLTATQTETKQFLQKAMLWCLNKKCFQLLTHLRSLGYPVGQRVIAESPVAMAQYLYHTYPPIVVPSFRNIDNQPTLYEQETCDELFDLEKSMEVVDNRPYMEVTRLYALIWKDIHLVIFSEAFLEASTVDMKFIVHVDLSHNKLLRVPDALVTLPSLKSLNVSHNELHGFPLPDVWGARSKLAILNLSHNKIYKGTFTPSGGLHTGSMVNRTLWYLDISSNNLQILPAWVLQLHGLRSLHMEYNKKITSLPAELYSVLNLNSIHIDALKLINPPLFIAQQGFQSTKKYMNQRAESSASWNFLQLVLVGPKSSGKTYLSARLRNAKFNNKAGPTKGVQIDDWKFSVREFLASRRDFHFDVWDFGGSDQYSEVYNHFPAVGSVHMLVLSIHSSHQDLFRWLIDIQCRKSTPVPVIIVFTHLDAIASKAEREHAFQKQLTWIIEHIIGNHAVIPRKTDHASFTHSLRTITDAHRRFDDIHYQFDAVAPHQTGNAAHLMPTIVDVACVSNTTGNGIPQLRNRLYKILTDPIPTLLPILGPLGMGINVPAVYVELAQVIYNLRLQSQRPSTHGIEPFLYTMEDLRKRISLQVRNPPACDLLPVLQFMKKCGLIGLYKTRSGNYLVCLSPQLVGNVIARILRIAKSDKSNTGNNAESNTGFLHISHINMILGEPVGNVSEGDFHNFFHELNLFAIVEGTMIVPSCISDLPRLPTVDLGILEWKRSFFLAYLPVNLWNDFATMLLGSLATEKDMEYSLSSAAPISFNPIILQSGAKLFVWKHSIFMSLDDKLVFYVCLDDGSCESEDEYLYRRIDVKIHGDLEMQAQLMGIASNAFEKVLSKRYPGLLRTNLGNSLVDDFLPLQKAKQQKIVYGDTDLAEKIECKTHSRTSSTSSGSMKLSRSFPSMGDKQPFMRTQSETVPTLKRNTSILQWFKDNDVTFNCSTAVLDEVYGPDYIPFSVWECLEIAYHSSVVMHCGIPVCLEEYMPEIFLSLKSLPKFTHSTSLIGLSPASAYTDDYLMSDKEIQETGGYFLRHFYKPSHKEICLKHSVNHNRMKCLLQCVEMAKTHYAKLKALQSDHIVSVCGINVSPPTVALESAPYGSLRGILKNKPNLLNRSTSHSIVIQVCKALNFLMEQKVHYHSIQSENILIWTLDPLVVRLSDGGVMQKSHKCVVCNAQKEFTDSKEFSSNVLDIFMLGVLCFELATGKRPYEDVYPLSLFITGILQGNFDINIEASLLLHQTSGNASSCSKMCLQMFMQECFDARKSSSIMSTLQLLPKLSLCSGDGNWSPLRTCVNIECIDNSTCTGLVHWASGSRGLVVGTLDPVTGKTSNHILQAAPTPTSGLFANRKGKPAPIAVGRASAIAIVKETQQMWVGTENGSMGSVYVFNLPDMDMHYYIHMQDAVLCLLACNDALYKVGASQRSKHSVLVGLANGTIQIFTGHSNDGTTICDNPLQGQRQVIAVPNRLSCLSMVLTPSGDIWCACGDTIQILDTSKLQFRDSLVSDQHRNSPVLQHTGIPSSPKSVRHNPSRLSTKEVSILAKLHENTKADLIVLLVYSSQGIWSVVRRGTSVKLWDINTNKIKTEFDIKSYFDDDNISTTDSITAMAAQGQVIWIGTRAGRLLLLDVSAPQPQRIPPLLGIQQYGKNNGKVKCIVPFTGMNSPSASLSVVCSIEQPDEICSILLPWEYQNRY